MHKGLDFAGPEGTKVSSVAAGLVTFAGERAGYGEMVEINHGNGLATRYCHNEKLLVKQGDMVRKGQEVALMGSTGRSTGPHLHFEVLEERRAGRSAALHRRGSLSPEARCPQGPLALPRLEGGSSRRNDFPLFRSIRTIPSFLKDSPACGSF